MSHQGSCHCGRIAFTLEGEIETAIDCNCSLCRRRGSLLAFFPRSALALHTPEADIATPFAIASAPTAAARRSARA